MPAPKTNLIPYSCFAYYDETFDECKKCKHKYIPTYHSVFSAMHLGRTRYMKCPKCNRYSWNKKVLLGGNQND